MLIFKGLLVFLQLSSIIIDVQELFCVKGYSRPGCGAVQSG